MPSQLSRAEPRYAKPRFAMQGAASCATPHYAEPSRAEPRMPAKPSLATLCRAAPRQPSVAQPRSLHYVQPRFAMPAGLCHALLRPALFCLASLNRGKEAPNYLEDPSCL